MENYSITENFGSSNEVSIAQYVRRHREEAGLTQLQLAKYANVSLDLVREIESGSGSIPLDALNRVLDIFGSEMTLTTDKYKQWRPSEELLIANAREKTSANRIIFLFILIICAIGCLVGYITMKL